jgi:hypothetical protein
MKKLFSIMLILSIVISFSNAQYRTSLLKKYNIDVGNGKTVWLTVDLIDNYGKCFELSIGGDFYGGASNCSSDIGGYWSYHGCGKSQRSANGDVSVIANKIIQECTN